MKNLIVNICLILIMLIGVTGVGQADNLWGALKSDNHFVLIRHALAPGYSDPDHFQVDNCTTQRNLNAEGRYQSKKIGDLFRSNGISKAAVYSSQWCRCLDTARLLNLGKVSELNSLNSFFEHFDREESQTIEIKRWLKTVPLSIPTVLVSHQVNIDALTGYSPSSGEIIFVRRSLDGSLSVIGSIPTLD
tara:strand:+ start:154 stop:723 length:570 start_codon:yes stop_codon:yes gene_type:complete